MADLPEDVAARLRRQVVASYETPQSVAFYSQAASSGLKIWEKTVVDRLFAAGTSTRTILVVGCGGGREIFGLEDLGFDVSGVDVSAALIAEAHNEASRRESRAVIVLGDGAHFPFADGAFDAVVIWSQVLGHVPLSSGRAAFLAEARRVVRSGGAMSLSAHDQALTMPLLDPARIVSRDYPELGDLVIDDSREAAVRYFRYFEEADLRGLCEGAGFAVEAVVHTDDLGEAWGNVFVVMARAV